MRILVLLTSLFIKLSSQIDYNCNELLMGQFLCPDPTKSHIDPQTQQFYGCTKENKAKGKLRFTYKLHINIPTLLIFHFSLVYCSGWYKLY